ncbi:AarF/UbiB family protein [Myxococcota bacterium]|nr:AarF/UbiB family protein [Myxococcota bacterium]
MVSIINTVRDLDRLRQIALVLWRHGFGEVVERTGIARVVRKGSTEDLPAGVDASRQSFGPRLRMVLQDLGPTFVKLGQILSTRPDLIPADIIFELKKLQDRVGPVPFAALKEQVESELGAPISELFAHFDEAPLASASIGQVHRAKLKLAPLSVGPGVAADGAAGSAGAESVTGTEGEAGSTGAPPIEPPVADVVVKIQRPNIKNTVERDIELLHILARAIEQGIPEARIYSPVGLVTEFERAMTAELDFSQEADHAERFTQMFEGDPSARFPRVYRAASAKRVLTLEFLRGVKPQDAVGAGHSGELISKLALSVLFRQIFEEGFFHADPHPGNLLILGTPEAPVLGMIDLGLVGRLSPHLRTKTIDLMVAAVRKDAQGVADALYAIGTPTKRINRAQYDAEVTVLAEKYLGKPLREIELSMMIRDLVTGAVKYGLEIPPEFLMLGRTLMTIEGVGKELFPDLDVFSEVRPFFMRLVVRRYSPERLGMDALRTMSRFGDTATGIPAKLDDVLDDLRRGALTVRSSDPTLPAATDLLGRRLFSGLTVAALIAGGSLLIASRSAELLGYGMLAGAGVWVLGHGLRAALAARAIKRTTR